jgi:electron transfer flavoprotein-quinone oxidoreductase
MSTNKADVIIVGAGIAGAAAGITLARAGKKTVIIERGSYAGAKNMFGGAIYDYPTRDLYPTFREEAPIERINKKHQYMITDDKTSVTVSYDDKEDETSYTVIRAKWDKWCIDKAVELGAYYSPDTIVRELIVENGKVIGIKTDEEEFFADTVILADGVNSLLAKQIGLRNNLKDSEIAIGIKEVIRLPKEVIENRFNIEDGEGSVTQVIGSPMKGITGLGYIYTNKSSISIGIGVNLDDLKRHKITPNELLEKLKAHPSIKPIIKGGELIEYSAHLIPEGGYRSMPKLYAAGVMVVGDAAMLVDNIHWEGTNIAMMSGKLAAETAIEALNKNDFSERMLSLYEQKLKETSFYKDLYTYKDTVRKIHNNAHSLLRFYPEKINEFFKMYTQAGYVPKASLYRKYIKKFVTDRTLTRLIKDIIVLIKIGFGVLK